MKRLLNQLLVGSINAMLIIAMLTTVALAEDPFAVWDTSESIQDDAWFYESIETPEPIATDWPLEPVKTPTVTQKPENDDQYVRVTVTAEPMIYGSEIKVDDTRVITLTIGSSTAYIDGERTRITSSTGELLTPYISNGNTMVPLRFISEEMGAYVEWNNATKEITIYYEGRVAVLKIDSTKTIVDNEIYYMNEKPELANGNTYVPLRFLCEEVLNKYVEWDNSEKKITISKPNPYFNIYQIQSNEDGNLIVHIGANEQTTKVCVYANKTGQQARVYLEEIDLLEENEDGERVIYFNFGKLEPGIYNINIIAEDKFGNKYIRKIEDLYVETDFERYQEQVTDYISEACENITQGIESAVYGVTDGIWSNTTLGGYDIHVEPYLNREEDILYLIFRAGTGTIVGTANISGAITTGGAAIVSLPATGVTALAVAPSAISTSVYCGSVAIESANDVATSVAKIAQLVQNAGGSDSRKETENKLDNLPDDILDTSETTKGVDGKTGHTFEKHVGKSWGDLSDRLQNSNTNISSATSFPDKQTAVRAFKDVVAQNKTQIANWLQGTEAKITITSNHSFDVGYGINQSYSSNTLRGTKVVLLRANNANGFIIRTFYPTF